MDEGEALLLNALFRIMIPLIGIRQLLIYTHHGILVTSSKTPSRGEGEKALGFIHLVKEPWSWTWTWHGQGGRGEGPELGWKAPLGSFHRHHDLVQPSQPLGPGGW